MDESGGERERRGKTAGSDRESDMERGDSKTSSTTRRRDRKKTDAADDAVQSEPLLGKSDENNNSSNSNNNGSFFMEHQNAASKVPDVQRSSIIGAMNARQRHLDRASAAVMPEIHIVGEIKSCTNIISDESEGAFFRWKVDHGPAFHHIGGDTVGQTQVAFAGYSHEDELIISHPIDVHLVELGIPGLKSPIIMCQSCILDQYNRRIMNGYGFCHLPLTTGFYKLEVPLWRPVGTADQEMESYFMQTNPALISPDPIFDSAWKDRCKLVTTSTGTLYIEVYVVCRNRSSHGVDHP
jgi:B9 domain-containing protein 2